MNISEMIVRPARSSPVAQVLKSIIYMWGAFLFAIGTGLCLGDVSHIAAVLAFLLLVLVAVAVLVLLLIFYKRSRMRWWVRVLGELGMVAAGFILIGIVTQAHLDRNLASGIPLLIYGFGTALLAFW